ncbi:MAG: lysylphosphatidylglycerol synthase transmembrane domain-containing protein, partial [Myxococcota bacterium]
QWVAGSIFFGASGVLLLMRFTRAWFAYILELCCGFLPEALGAKIHGFGVHMMEGIHCLRWDRFGLGVLCSSVLIWLVEGAMFLALLPAFGLSASLVMAYIAMSMTNLGSLVPAGPGNLGTFHVFCAKALVLFGVPYGSAVGYAVVLHALQYIPLTLLGLVALNLYGFRLRTFFSLKPPSREETEQEQEIPQWASA